MADTTQTDVSRPSALPTANLSNRNLSATQSNLTAAHAHLDASEYLDAVQEDLNKRVDNEVDILVDGMVDLVEISSVSVISEAKLLLLNCARPGW
jgi:mediator of RNA polymerase II transcription subunit 22